MLTELHYALTITLPILALLSLGIFLRRLQWLDESFVSTGNRMVFTITLPCLLFLGISSQPLSLTINTKMIAFGVCATLVVVSLLLVISPYIVSKEKRGVFVQGAFRGNMGIISMALILNAYDTGILPTASIYLAFLTVMYNLLSIWLLKERQHHYISLLIKNPLIISVLAGISFSLFSIELPVAVRRSGEYLAQMTLPFALLCICASLSWNSFKINHKDVLWATGIKLIIIPSLVCAAAIALGFRGKELGVIFFMMAPPTAAVSYVMASQMTAYGKFAGEIVALSTVFSVFSLTAGLLILRFNGFL